MPQEAQGADICVTCFFGGGRKVSLGWADAAA